ncbi:MAG: hypothetical protein PUP91_10075 [Rhizonema sp. PD37]|nr:hypothetical protein [Rhizonema sp. PD37]
MDYIYAGYSPKSFRHHFPQIADKQFDAATLYIEVNHAEIETEYQIVLKEAAESRQYWEEQNRERFVQNVATLPKTGYLIHKTALDKNQS